MSDDNWNFKLDDEVAKNKKKNTTKPLLKQSNKDLRLGLDSSEGQVRRSRRQMAKDEGGTSIRARDIIEPAAHWRRGLAFIIDILVLVLVLGFSVGVNTLYSGIGDLVINFLGTEISQAIPGNPGVLVLAFLAHFFLIVIPTASTQRSIGKKFLKLKILGTLKSKAPLGVLIIREYLAKPLALISIIGIIIIPLNEKRRGLHDFISGTFVIDNF